MKKGIKIEMYLDAVNEYGDRNWNYVCTIWGDSIEFDCGRWYLRAANGSLVSCGNVSELHGKGYDGFDYKLINVIRY